MNYSETYSNKELAVRYFQYQDNDVLKELDRRDNLTLTDVMETAYGGDNESKQMKFSFASGRTPGNNTLGKTEWQEGYDVGFDIGVIFGKKIAQEHKGIKE